MQPISLFLIGAHKAGTTSLQYYLQSHPDIFMPEVTELEFFSDEQLYRRGEKYLDFHYQAVRDESVIGLPSVQLMFFPCVPERLHRYNPDAKILAVLRNPIDRAYSAYWYHRRNGAESATTFEDALERDRTVGYKKYDYHQQADFLYLEHGHYCEQINRFRAFFPPEQIHIVLTEDLRDRPQYWCELQQWLGVRQQPTTAALQQRHNEASMPKAMWLQRLVKAADSPFKRVYRAAVPRPVRSFVTRNVTDRMISRNLVPFSYPPMKQATRDALQAYFQPHNEALARLMGRSLEHWR